jgi:alpha-L-arabinofuranosidase
MKMTYIPALILVCVCTAIAPARNVTLTVDPDRVVAEIDCKIYGHFLEHIFHSVNGGLWGELIWNRSFEQNAMGQWTVIGDPGPLNAVAARSKDGAKLYYKVVNPSEQPVHLELTVKSPLPIARAGVQLVSADSLEARNTLHEPHSIRPAAAELKTDGKSVHFTMPAFSVGVVSVTRMTAIR